MRALPLVLLFLSTSAFAGALVAKAKNTAATTLGLRATTSTWTLTNPGDAQELEVVVPTKLAAYGVADLKAGAVVQVKVVSPGVIEIHAGAQTVTLDVDANGGVRRHE